MSHPNNIHPDTLLEAGFNDKCLQRRAPRYRKLAQKGLNNRRVHHMHAAVPASQDVDCGHIHSPYIESTLNFLDPTRPNVAWVAHSCSALRGLVSSAL